MPPPARLILATYRRPCLPHRLGPVKRTRTRSLSTTTTTTKDTPNQNASTHIMSSVIQGPSLVQTSLYRPSPSLMFLPGLRSLPLWTSLSPDDGMQNRVAYQDPTITHIVEYLQGHVPTFQDEYDRVILQDDTFSLPSDYTTNSTNSTSTNSTATSNDNHPNTRATTEHTLHRGSWDWHSYMRKGKVSWQQPDLFAQYFPQTTSILERLRDQGWLFEGTPFGYCFFSTLHGASAIRPHTGPINFRLRVHVPLRVPQEGNCGIRVGPVRTVWHEGKALVLDDSYEHEVFNDADEKRVLLLVDVWHPDVTAQERQQIVQMFQHAQEQGWLGVNEPV